MARNGGFPSGSCPPCPRASRGCRRVCRDWRGSSCRRGASCADSQSKIQTPRGHPKSKILRGVTMSEPIRSLVIIAGVLAVTLTIAAGLIWLERRLLALWQDRYGPNRVGPFGLLQVVADMVKIFTKEDWIPPFADKPIFVLAPAVIVATVLLSFAVVPFARGVVVVDLN